MSYILEALKKSSEERARLVCVAASDSPAVSAAGQAIRRPARWPLAIIGVGALAVIAFFGISAAQRNEAPASAATVAKTSDTAATADVAKNPEPADAAPTTAKVKSRPAKDPAPQSPPSAPPPKKFAAKLAPPPEVPLAASGSTPQAASEVRGEMPPALLQQVQAIPISAHIYSSKPAERMVIITGRAVREGDALPSGALVEQITPDGISVSVQGYRAKRSVQ